MMLPYYFIHTASGRSWPTSCDPQQWLLDHRDDDLLGPARERLVLSSGDPERCLRAVLRRCGLALVCVVADSRIVVRYWSDPAPDMRTSAKKIGWNRSGVQVVFVQEKTGKGVVQQDAEDLLVFGKKVGPNYPWREYEAKYERRLVEEWDDGDAASASATNFEWVNHHNKTLNWTILKAIWNGEWIDCPNCDVPLVLTAFCWQKGMLSFRSGVSIRHCLRCHRRFAVAEERPLEWLANVLPPNMRPTHLRLWTAISIDWPRLSLGHAQPVQITGRDGG